MTGAEASHDAAHTMLGLVGRSAILRRLWQRQITGVVPDIQSQVFNLNVHNPVGLAAGFDKNASCIHALQALGSAGLSSAPSRQDLNPATRAHVCFGCPNTRQLSIATVSTIAALKSSVKTYAAFVPTNAQQAAHCAMLSLASTSAKIRLPPCARQSRLSTVP